MKSIVVVAKDGEKDHALRLIREITRSDEYEVSFSTPGQLLDYQATQSRDLMTIFIGAEGRSVCQDRKISIRYENCGIVWGWDGPLAIIFADSSKINKLEYRRLVGNAHRHARQGRSRIVGLLAFGPLTTAFVSISVKLGLTILKRYYRLTDRLYRLAAFTFMNEAFQEYLADNE